MNSSFIFLDETGRLAIPVDRFFGVGLVKCPEPAAIQRPMQAMRDQEHFWQEIKWWEVRQNNLRIYRKALACFFDCPEAKFACFISDKQSNDPIRRFGNEWTAYERLSAQLLVGNIARQDEFVTVLADEYSTPPGVKFEENVRDLVHRRLGREAITGVCRMRSTGVDLFQMLDLLLGAAAYEHKIAAGLVPHYVRSPKARLLRHIQDRMGVDSFIEDVRTDRVNVKHFGQPVVSVRS